MISWSSNQQESPKNREKEVRINQYQYQSTGKVREKSIYLGRKGSSNKLCATHEVWF